MSSNRFTNSSDRRFNNLGFTIIEILIAMSAISVSSVGLLWSINAVRDNNQRMELVATVTDLEGSVVNELLDKSNYSPAVMDQMKNGQVPQMNFTLEPATSAQRPSLTLGRPLNLTRDLRSCDTLGLRDCVMQIEVQMRRITDPATGRAHFAYAYRINTQDREVAFRYTGAGSNLNPQGGFTNDEFKLTVPYDFYLQGMQIMCMGANMIALNGIDVSTGQPSCIKQPEAGDECPNGRLPKRLQYIQDSTGGRIVFDCGDPIRQATCGGRDNYLLQEVDTTTLDSFGNRQKVGRCVFAGSNPASTTFPMVPTPAKRISGRACPPGYRSESTCHYVNVQSTGGVCNWCWGAARDCATSVVSENPPGSGNFTRTTNFFCSDTTGNQQSPPTSMPNFTQNIPEPGYVDCSVQTPPLTCGGTFQADVQLNVNCVMDPTLNPPEFMDVQ